MNTTNSNHSVEEKPVYQTPTITTFTAAELLEIIGPVHAGSGPGDMGPMGPLGSGGAHELHKILKIV